MNSKTIKTIFCKRKLYPIGFLLIISVGILSLSFQPQNKKITKITEFVIEVIEDENEIILKKYFPKVKNLEIKRFIFDFFKEIRVSYNKNENRKIHIKKLNKVTYQIEIDESRYPILIYGYHCRLKIKSVTPLLKGDIIVGWVRAKLK